MRMTTKEKILISKLRTFFLYMNFRFNFTMHFEFSPQNSSCPITGTRPTTGILTLMNVKNCSNSLQSNYSSRIDALQHTLCIFLTILCTHRGINCISLSSKSLCTHFSVCPSSYSFALGMDWISGYFFFLHHVLYFYFFFLLLIINAS